MASIETHGLGKRYLLGKRKLKRPDTIWERMRGKGSPPRERQELWALRDVSFAVEPGVAQGVIGHNGAGKSTLLRVLARITPPTEGRAIVRGRVVSLLELGAGFQPEYTGRENVYLNAAMYDIPRSVVDRRFDDIVEFAGLEQFIDTPVKRFSSGMYLRLAFSVAVNMEPDVLLADEILAVGDLGFQERCLQRIDEAGRQGLTVLFVSHDMAAVRRLCPRVLWLDHGRIQGEGPAEDVIKGYERASWGTVPGDADRATSEDAQLVSTRLLSADGEEVGAGRVDEELQVALQFRLARAARVRCGVALSCEGIVAFTSVQPRALELPSGEHLATVRLPAHLLADRHYTVKASVLVDVGGEQLGLARDRALAFQVYDVDEAASRGNYDGTLNGLVRPRLTWDVAPSGVPGGPR